MILAVISFALFLFLLYVGTVRLFFPKKAAAIRDNIRKKEEARALAQKDKENEALAFRIIPGRAIQLMESIEIMMHTKKKDILTSRYHFALETMTFMSTKKDYPIYKDALMEAVERYKLQYPKSVFNDYQNYFLQFPQDTPRFQDFYTEQLARWVMEHSQIHQEAINAMVQPRAKIKRYEKILEGINAAVEEVKVIDSSDGRDDLIMQMKEIIPKVQAEIEKLN